jgi:hypothetical protein
MLHEGAHCIEYCITARPRNEEDGCQIVEGLYRKAHFPPVHAQNHPCRRSRRTVPNSYTTTRSAGIAGRSFNKERMVRFLWTAT